ncbi:MAG: S8 family serine peptidase [Clostridia bacterium]|nr:S8 family serine peptidase [Clostridia bacterium]
MKRLISIFITLSILFTSSLVGIYAETSKDISESDTSTETQTLVSSSDSEKELSRPEESTEYVDFASAVSKEAKYADDSIIVTMKRGVKEANHVYTAEDFPELDVDYIEDLTYLTNKELLNDPEFMANYTQILQIHLKSPSEEKVLSSVGSLSKRSTSDIASAAPNYEMEVMPETSEEFELPNDPHYSDQEEYFERIKLPQAWGIIEEKTSSGEITPTTVKVAVIDVGILDHPDLLSVTTGFDAVNDTDQTNDPINDSKVDHGVMVAGVLGATANNSIGIAGICWNVQIFPIQLAGNKNDAFVRTITYLNNNNIPIANMSLGHTTDNLEFPRDVINNYFGLLIMSAGNDGLPTTGSTRISSLDCSNILTVMGTEYVDDTENEDDTHDKIEKRNTNSNYSNVDVDIAAPYRAYTTVCENVVVENGVYSYTKTYGSANGTSMSTPYVAGVAAMLKSIVPYLSTYDIKQILMNSVEEYENLANECVSGGFLDAQAAINMALYYETPEPQTFTVDVNFDGYDDLVYLREYDGDRHIQVFLGSNANHIGTPAVSPSTSDTTKCSVDTLTADEFKETDVAFMGDVNGDHFMDMIVHSSTATNKRLFHVYLGQQNGKFSTTAIVTTTNDLLSNVCKLFIGDFNGDFKCDFLVHYSDPDDGTRTNLVYISNGDGTFATGVTSTSTSTYVAGDEVKVIDVNGDGSDDVVVHWADEGIRQLLVYRAYTNGRFSSPINVDTGHYHSNEFPCKFLVGNFNGDDFGDFYVWWRGASGNGNHIIYYGKPNGRFETGVSINTTLCYDENQQLFVGDVNNDNVDDLIMHWPDPTTGEVRLRVCYGGTTNALSVANTVNTSTTHVITGNDTVYRVHVGDFNGWGTDIITEKASSETAYRSTALVNLGTANGFQSATYTHNLRTYFYIDYN